MDKMDNYIELVNNTHNEMIKNHSIDSASGFSKTSQEKRFETILSQIKETSFSILDYGCNVADLLTYLLDNNRQPEYIGVDINEFFIKKCIEKFPNNHFLIDCESLPFADYVIASGLMAYKFDGNREIYLNIIRKLWKSTKIALIFNCLTKRNHKPCLHRELYNPEDFLPIIDELGCTIFSIHHDYLPNDFTIVMRKQ